MNDYTERTDLELMKKIREYDSRALEALYNRYSSFLYTLIKKISPDEITASDVLIDVFVIIWRKIDKFDFAKGNVFTWLVTLARNKAVDELRKKRTDSESNQPYNDSYEDYYILPLLSDKIDKLDIETAKKIKPKIEKALEKLTDTQKYVIYLSFYEGYNVNEIADKLKLPVETVRSKIMTAMHNLKDNLIAE